MVLSTSLPSLYGQEALSDPSKNPKNVPVFSNFQLKIELSCYHS